jgi:hypothetical protein
MEEFNASLIREKIIFMEGISGEDDDAVKEPVVVRSNRIFLRLGPSAAAENVVIRAQNMHSTLRLAGKILSSYGQDGPFSVRNRSFDWGGQWDAVLSAYEKKHNHDIWAAVYLDGKPVLKTIKSPFIDVVEKCALLTIDNYDAAMDVAESALKQIGRAVRISHSSSVAATFADSMGSMRCGIMHRGGSRNIIFSFTGTGGGRYDRIVHSIDVAAAYLETLNLNFIINQLQEKIRNGEIRKAAPETGRIQPAMARQVALNKDIFAFEEIYGVQYRPEKPDLFSDA